MDGREGGQADGRNGGASVRPMARQSDGQTDGETGGLLLALVAYGCSVPDSPSDR